MNEKNEKNTSYKAKFTIAAVSLLLFAPMSYVSYFDIRLSQSWSDFLHIPSGLGIFGLAATYGLFTENMKQMYRMLLLSILAAIFITVGHFLYEHGHIGRKVNTIAMVTGIVTIIFVIIWSFATWEQIMEEVRNSGASKPLGAVFLLSGITGTLFLVYNYKFFISLNRAKMVSLTFFIAIGLVVSGGTLLYSSKQKE